MKKVVSDIREFVLRHRKEGCLLGILLMVVMLVISIALTANFHVFTNDEIVVNCMIDLIGMLFSMVLYFGCFSLNAEGGQVGWCFEALVFTCFLLFFGNHTGYVLVGYPRFRVLQMHIMTIVSYVMVIAIAIFWEFFVALLELPKRRYRIGSCIVYPIVIFEGAALVFNAFTGIVFSVNVLSEVQFHPLYNLGVCLTMVVYLTIFVNVLISNGSFKTKIMLLTYVLLPSILLIIDTFSSIGQADRSYDSLIYIGVLLSLNINFCHSYVEQGKEMLQQKITMLEQKQHHAHLENAIMLSQIQPHFIYNSLATISHLCKKDAALAKEAVDKFSEYLRQNTKAMSSEHRVPFAQEIEHTETYLWLEQLRFGDSLKVEYDIEYTDFLLPPLTLQPLVENAVKHGIRGKEDGGTVRISTHHNQDGVTILIEDDGAGFVPGVLPKDGKLHVGIPNVSERVRLLCGGDVRIESEPGKGTEVTIFLPEKMLEFTKPKGDEHTK